MKNFFKKIVSNFYAGRHKAGLFASKVEYLNHPQRYLVEYRIYRGRGLRQALALVRDLQKTIDNKNRQGIRLCTKIRQRIFERIIKEYPSEMMEFFCNNAH